MLLQLLLLSSALLIRAEGGEEGSQQLQFGDRIDANEVKEAQEPAEEEEEEEGRDGKSLRSVFPFSGAGHGQDHHEHHHDHHSQAQHSDESRQ